MRGGPPLGTISKDLAVHTWIVHNLKFGNILCKEYLSDPKGKNILKPKKKVTEEVGLGHLYVRKCCQALELSFIDYVTYSHQAIYGSTNYGSPAIRCFFKHSTTVLANWPIELCGVLISFSLDILSLFCTNQPFYIQINQEKHMVPIFQKCKRPPDNFQMFST